MPISVNKQEDMQMRRKEEATNNPSKKSGENRELMNTSTILHTLVQRLKNCDKIRLFSCTILIINRNSGASSVGLTQDNCQI